MDVLPALYVCVLCVLAAGEGQKTALDHLELELQTVVTTMGVELMSSVRTASALTH